MRFISPSHSDVAYLSILVSVLLLLSPISYSLQKKSCNVQSPIDRESLVGSLTYNQKFAISGWFQSSFHSVLAWSNVKILGCFHIIKVLGYRKKLTHKYLALATFLHFGVRSAVFKYQRKETNADISLIKRRDFCCCGGLNLTRVSFINILMN